MIGFGIWEASGTKEIRSENVAQWEFGNLLVPFGPPKMILVDADGNFTGMFKINFQDTLLIQVHAVSRGKHKAIRN